MLVEFVEPGVSANVPGCVKPKGAPLRMMVTNAVEAEIYAGRRAAAPVLLSPGIVIVNRASASGPLYLAAIPAGVVAACGKDALRGPPPPHDASAAANSKNGAGAIGVVRRTVVHQT